MEMDLTLCSTSSYMYIDFIYILGIVLGGVSVTLVAILNTKEKSSSSKAILFFTGSVYLYMLIDFIMYYFISSYDFDQNNWSKTIFILSGS